MNRSPNSFSLTTISKSANSFSSTGISLSSNSFSNNKQGGIIKISNENGWTGDNVTDSAISDDLFSNQFGGEMYGGIAHFKKL